LSKCTYTYLDPPTAKIGRDGTSVAAEVKLHASAAAAANLPGRSFGNILKPPASSSTSHPMAMICKSDIEAEIVYAVQNCKVNFKLFSCQNVEKSSLGPARWKIHWGVGTVEESEKDNTIEAELEEEFDEH
jgi:hypothetical protein